MKKIFLFAPLILYACAACVSLSVGPKPPEKAKTVRFSAPGTPFSEITVLDVDKAWQNKKNGNTISYKTSCDEAADPSLEFQYRSLLEGIDQLEVEKKESTTFNGREAIHSRIRGKLDGIATNMEILVFRKNNCSYTLSYVAVPSNFEADAQVFASFLKGFEAL